MNNVADNFGSSVGQGAGTGAGLGAITGPEGALIGAGVGALAGGAEYLWNRQQAKKDEKKRPIYQIPPEVQQGLTLAEHQALQGLPEAQKAQYVSNLQRGAAFSLAQNQTRGGGLSNIAAINENQNQGYAGLVAQDAAARYQRQGQVFNQLGNVANEKEQQWQINMENPYYERTYNDRANRGALYKNIGNAAQLGLYAGAGGKSAQTTQQPENNLDLSQGLKPFSLG